MADRLAAPTTLIGLARAHAGASTALVADDAAVSYGELWDRVDARRRELDLDQRSLVVLAGANSLEFVVTYLALLDGRHVPVLAASTEHAETLVEQWRPTAAVTVDGASVRIERLRSDSPDLHPDLALLLGTSGSTGSPKLVRLSQRNLHANATSIATFLGLTADDVGITSLPLHYCYGLSLLHSHLLVGAELVVTDGSVVDPCFAAAMDRHAVTNLAGVPHTFEMLERVGPDRIAVPSLRLLTQAGGRLGPDAVVTWLDRADAWGAEFVVMYGQTEATARMAYLPPTLARLNPGAIGVAIPGGELRIDPVDGDGDGSGELVYRGANVMMGYARDADDLARGAELDELRTGDLARFDETAGVFEIVGRRSRFVKPFGLRIDLDQVEARLRAVTAPVAVTGDDERIYIVAPGADAAAVRSAAARQTSLPARLISVSTDVAIPRTTSGKVDLSAVAA
ncbi:MAG: AMP-binding protein, partial [Ilumatobacter sp.]|nr:AMP-binding protein [Ilumatobacter sp.]